MAEYELALSEDERKCLTELLENHLKQTLIEEHRTRTTYREFVEQQEKLEKSVLEKLRKLTPAATTRS
jgi:hypothetical protein